MAKKNFTITTVATAPSPATSGTSLVVAAGTGSLFALNEPAIIFPVNDQPLVANAEIVMVTNVSTDTLTITRTQESTSARTIVAGDIIIQGITAKDWNDLVTLVAGKITAFADPNADRIVFWDDSAGAFAALTASTGLTISGTNMTVRTSSATQTGIVELATTAETQTGTDATRAVTPDGLHDMTSLAGAGWIKDEDNMASNDDTKVPTQQSVKAYVDNSVPDDVGDLTDTGGIYVPSSVKSGDGDVVVTANSTDISGAGEYLAKFDADGNIADSGLHSGDITTDDNAQTLTNKKVQLTASPSSDHTASGTTILLTATANVAFGDVCYIASTGKASLIDADAIASMSAIVMAIATISADASGEFLLMGIARDDTWNWTVGGLIYGTVTGTTGNTLSQTAPTGTDDVVQIMGVATHADRMYFNPQLVQIERT